MHCEDLLSKSQSQRLPKSQSAQIRLGDGYETTLSLQMLLTYFHAIFIY